MIGTYTDTGVMGTGGDTGVKEGADGDTVTGADAVRAGGGADGGASGGVRGVSGGDDGGSGGVRFLEVHKMYIHVWSWDGICNKFEVLTW